MRSRRPGPVDRSQHRSEPQATWRFRQEPALSQAPPRSMCSARSSATGTTPPRSEPARSQPCFCSRAASPMEMPREVRARCAPAPSTSTTPKKQAIRTTTDCAKQQPRREHPQCLATALARQWSTNSSQGQRGAGQHRQHQNRAIATKAKREQQRTCIEQRRRQRRPGFCRDHPNEFSKLVEYLIWPEVNLVLCDGKSSARLLIGRQADYQRSRS
jgi:hypothetical protein